MCPLLGHRQYFMKDLYIFFHRQPAFVLDRYFSYTSQKYLASLRRPTNGHGRQNSVMRGGLAVIPSRLQVL